MRPRKILLSLLLAGILHNGGFMARSADWPQWRGPDRTGLSAEKGLLRNWPEDGPKTVWSREDLGASYSSVSVADGRVFTQGNGEDSGKIFCLNEKTGETIWAVTSPAEKKLYTHGRGDGARGTPTVDGDRVYVEGAGGALTCLEAASGKALWSLHLLDDLNGGKRPPGWGYSESPLVDGNKVIVTPGGKEGAIAALNKDTGETIWRSTDLTDSAHYSSPIVAEILGVRQYIQFTRNRLVSVDAASGKLLWDYSESANGTANTCTPIAQDNFVFSSSAYGTGGGLVKVSRTGDEFSAEEVYFEKSMANHHGGIVLVDGYMYGFGSGGLICMDFKTGEIAWRNRSVGKGSLTVADGHLYCLSERNQIALVEANPKEYVEKGRFKLADSGKPTWAHPVVANGRLYIRDQHMLTAYDVSAD